MPKYVKLGKKARGGSFYEPNTGISVFGGKVQEVTDKQLEHKRVSRALTAGHIVETTKADFEEWMEANKKVAPTAKKEEAKKTDAGGSGDEVDFYTLKKPALIEYALGQDGIEETAEELEAMTKDEIYEVIEALKED